MKASKAQCGALSVYNLSKHGDDLIQSRNRSCGEISEINVQRFKEWVRETVKVVILGYQIESPKWQYAAVIVDKGSVRAAYATFYATDIHRNPLFALKFMGRFEWEYPSIERAKQAILQSQRFQCVTDANLLERLKIDLVR